MLTADDSSPASCSGTGAATAPSAELRFEFAGTAREYFGIWLVNTLLTIVTLGVYSAWAKVRSQRYFYRSTRLAGSSFDYTADPVQILKGRAIVAAVLLLLFVLEAQSVLLALAVFLLSLLLGPWVLARSLAFRARNTSFRNICFGFTGTPRQAYAVYLRVWLATALTLGVYYPYARHAITEYATRAHRFGDRAFTWYTDGSGYFNAYGKALLYVLLGLAAQWLLKTLGVAAAGGRLGNMALYFYFLVPLGFLRARLMNLQLSNLAIDGHRVACRIEPRQVIRLYLTNVLAIIATFGLAIPWARVRVARYQFSCLSLRLAGPLELTVSHAGAQVSALGDAAGDYELDLELGL